MPNNQSYKDVHYDSVLTNFSVAHWQDTSVFVGTRFFNVIPVNKASDKYDFYPQGYFNRVTSSQRSEEGKANTIGYKKTQKGYSCGDDALRLFISDRKRANTPSQQNLDMEATMVTTDSVLLTMEQRFVDNFLTAGKWAKDYVGGSLPSSGSKKWSDPTSDPLSDILKSRPDFVKRSGGRQPSKGLMTLDVLMTLLTHPNVLNRVDGGATTKDAAQITVQQLASLMMVDRIEIMQSIHNTAAEGIEDADGMPVVNNTFFAEGKFLLAHVAPSAGLYSPTAAATFVHNDYIPLGAENGPAVRRYRAEAGVKGEYVEAEMSIDQKLVSPDLGELWSDLL